MLIANLRKLQALVQQSTNFRWSHKEIKDLSLRKTLPMAKIEGKETWKGTLSGGVRKGKNVSGTILFRIDLMTHVENSPFVVIIHSMNDPVV